jgi:microcystin degradation protein MlrC
VKRVATGGLHSECSTWNPVLMQARDFRVLRAGEILAHPEFAVLGGFDIDWQPLLHARALPGGPVARPVYEAFKTEFLDGLKATLPLDGVYLSMHGAVFVEGMEDAEGDWIAATRAVVGPDVLVAASYDLHGSVSQAVVDGLDILSAYRTAPHIDVDETKARAVSMLCRALDDGVRPHLAWARIPVLLPGERTSTQDEPARSLYAALPGLDVWEAALLVGYVWGDEPRATASVVVTGTDPAGMARAAEQVAWSYWNARVGFTFGSRSLGLQDCLREALHATTAPVVLADSGDNPTGGGVGDRGDVLAVLLEAGATDTLLAGIADPPATASCYAAGVGATLSLGIGGALDLRGVRVQAEAEVVFLFDTPDLFERQAVVRIAGVTVVLTAKRRPFHTLGDFAVLGLDPLRVRLLVVKCGYLTPEIAAIANPSLMALTDGVVNQDIASLNVTRIHRPMFPWDTGFDWQPTVLISARAP